MAQIGRRLTPALRQRLRDIIVAREGGKLLREIAVPLGLTTERVRQLYRYGKHLEQLGKLAEEKIRRKKKQTTEPVCEKCGRVYCDHERKY